MKLYVDLKPTLEWAWDEKIGLYVAKTLFGNYTLAEAYGGFIVFFNGLFVEQRDYSSDAMAAAQADYERRTAERFREVTLPEPKSVLGAYDDAGYLRQYGAAAYKKHIELLARNIQSAMKGDNHE